MYLGVYKYEKESVVNYIRIIFVKLRAIVIIFLQGYVYTTPVVLKYFQKLK